jgi:hypothetical protein
MTDKEESSDLPRDPHLREDVVPDTDQETQDGVGQDGVGQDGVGKRLPPGQTNADQQVAGLAAATHYSDDMDPEAETDGNKPL